MTWLYFTSFENASTHFETLFYTLENALTHFETLFYRFENINAFWDTLYKLRERIINVFWERSTWRRERILLCSVLSWSYQHVREYYGTSSSTEYLGHAANSLKHVWLSCRGCAQNCPNAFYRFIVTSRWIGRCGGMHARRHHHCQSIIFKQKSWNNIILKKETQINIILKKRTWRNILRKQY